MNRPALFVGAAFGFLIAAARLNSYDVIHDMLLLRELDVYLLMASAVGTAAPLLLLLKRIGWRTTTGEPMKVRRVPVRQDNVLGAMVFGAGWAIAGTCPGPAIAMVTAGNFLGVAVIAGLVSGIFLYDRLAAARAFHLSDPPRPHVEPSGQSAI